MMNENSFYMFLPSDSNLDIFPENSPGKFSVQIEKSKNLEDGFECSLYDIILPELNPIIEYDVYIICSKNYDNPLGLEFLPSDNILLKIIIGPETIANRIKFIKELSERLSIYFNWGDFQKLIFEKFPHFKNLKLIYQPINFYYESDPIRKDSGQIVLKTGQIFIDQEKPDPKNLDGLRFFLMFDKNLATFLMAGNYETVIFTTEKYIISNDPLKFRFYDELKLDFREMYSSIHETVKEGSLRNNIDLILMCNIIEESFINNVKFPYFRLIHCDSKGKSKLKFDSLIYFKVIFNKIQTLEFNITDSRFRKVDFSNGSTIIVLHFRKRF